MKEKFDNLNPNVKVTIVLGIVFVIFAILLITFGPRQKKEKFKEADLSKITNNNLNDYSNFSFVENNLDKFISTNSDVATYEMLDKDYIKKNGVNESNALEKTGKSGMTLGFKLQKFNKVDNEDSVAYYATGILYKENEIFEIDVDDEKGSNPKQQYIEILNKEYGMLIIVDYDSIAFSVYPDITQKEMLNIINQKKDFKIERNTNNAFVKTPAISNVSMCVLYYNDMVFKINYMQDEFYDYISADSKTKFKDKKEYREYLDKYYSNYAYSFKTCEKGESKNQFYITDAENEFPINISDMMEYTVNLP